MNKSMSRLYVKDKSSVVVTENIEDIFDKLKSYDFIKVINLATGREEIYNKDYIWCVRQHREE